MDKDGYTAAIAALPTGLTDALRALVEYVDKGLATEHRRDVRFKESTFWDESGFLASLFGELLNDKEHEGAKGLQELLRGEWQIFTDDGKGALELDYQSYIVLKSALKEALTRQPFGYKRTLTAPRSKAALTLIQEDGKVLFRFDVERPIQVAKADDNQGKLLLCLGNPLVAQPLRSRHGE